MKKYDIKSLPRYIIISPAKDEEKYIELTLQSVIKQTHKPVLWVIVDDGSTDETEEIVNRYACVFPAIRLIANPNSGVRQPGSAVIRAFNCGYEYVDDVDYDFIVKLDCDLSFNPDYFEKLLRKFLNDKMLGIASGIYMEENGCNSWHPVLMPYYHAAGACKVLTSKCFEEIRGFITEAGWDTVDEIRAMARGWKTGHFSDLHMKHHKPEGSGIGPVRTSIMHGRIYYRCGGSLPFFILKVLHRIGAKLHVINAAALMWGYLQALMKREALLVSENEAKIYRRLLTERLLKQVKTLISRNWNFSK